jgi:DNA-binding winged helix-turn-helix (wHTH) protein
MSASIYCFDGFRLDTGRRQLLDPNGVEVKLTSHEIDVLVKFCQNPQQLLTRDQLTPRLNGRILSFERAVDVRIARLRRKLEDNRRKPTLIKTIRQSGYWFAPDVTIEPPAAKPPRAARDPGADPS